MKDQAVAFARITKVDELQKMVYGRAVQEVPDRANEVFDYATSKPYFEAWSKSQSDASMGKSHGNIRVMHTAKAAGIVVPNGMVFHDDECAIDYAVKITDDAEFNKCMDGTYTGFSIGGSYVKKWQDPDDPKLTRYTAKPSETSLVDRPCVDTATFTAIKADGTELQKHFKPAAAPVVEEPAKPTRKDMIEFFTKKGGKVEELGLLGDAELVAKYDEQRAADQAAIDAGPVLNVEVGNPEELEQFATFLAQKKMTLGDVLKALQPIVDPYAPAPADIVQRAKSMAKATVTPAAVEAEARALCQKAGKNPDSREQTGDYSVQAWMAYRKDAELNLNKGAGGDAWKAHVVAADRALRDEKLGITEEKLEAEVIKQAAGAEATDAHRDAALLELRKAEHVPLAALVKRDAIPARVWFGKGEFADPKNKKYPVDTEPHIRAAWSYINMPKNQKSYTAEEVSAIKSKIVSAWKKTIDKDGPPSADKIDGGKMVKGMYTVGTLARILDDLSYVVSSCEYEAASEGDGSDVPGRLAMCLKDLGAVLVDMCAEEVGEMSGGDDEDVGAPAMAAAERAEFAKGIVEFATVLVKAGARHSAADMKRVQDMHDTAVGLGAACTSKKDDHAHGEDGMQKALKEAADALAKFQAEAKADREALEKRIKHLEDQPAPTRVNAVLKVVTRGEQINTEEDSADGKVEPVRKADGSIDPVATAIKQSHANGGVVINRVAGNQ